MDTNSGKNGVDYRTNRIKRIERTYVEQSTSSLTSASQGASPLVDTEVATCQDSLDLGQEGGVLPEGAAAPDQPLLGEHNVHRAFVQFFDNGEDSRQRRKLRVRLNMEDHNVDFIAPLTTDRRNFVKHAHNRDEAAEWFDSNRSIIKTQYGVRPYQGKFHMVHSAYTDGKRHKIQVEPNCYGSVWYDKDETVYAFNLRIYDLYLFDEGLSKENLTVKQIKTGVKGQHLYVNPRFVQHTKKPMTYAEIIAERNKTLNSSR